jgi:hypothetical protein
MWRKLTADLEHDLGVGTERDRSGSSPPASASNEREHLAMEPGDRVRGQCLTPEREQRGERRRPPAVDDDHAGRFERAHRIRAGPTEDVHAAAKQRWGDADSGRHGEDKATGVKLDVRAVTRWVGPQAAQSADGSLT